MKLKELLFEQASLEILNDDQWNIAKTLAKNSGVAKALKVKRKFKIANGGELLNNTCENIKEVAKPGSIIMSDEGLKKDCGQYSMDPKSFEKKYKVIKDSITGEKYKVIKDSINGEWGIAEKIPGGSVEYILGLDKNTKVKSWNGMISAKENGSYAIRYGDGDYAFIDPNTFANTYQK